jgi:hypothetical protein
MRARPQLWLLLSLLAATAAWLYMNRVLAPWEHYFHVEAGTMKAALGDLYSPWFGARALLLQGKNPYGPEVTHEIQMAFYGHDVIQAYGSGANIANETIGSEKIVDEKIIDEQRFAYPVYLVFLLAPTVGMQFQTLQTAAPAVLAAAVASSVFLWLSVLRWRPPPMTALAAALFILASPQIAQGLRLRQLGMIVACLFALGTWLLLRNYLTLAGAVFALSTFKPQVVALPLSWLVIWSIGDLPKRWRLLAGFGTTSALLVGAGELILPGWPRDFIGGLIAYRKYGPVTTLLQLALGNRLGAVAAVALVAGLIAWGWSQRRHGADSPEFVFTLSAFFVVAAIALPLMSPFNQVLLILPVLTIVQDWAKLSKAARFAFVACVVWPWIASLVLLALPPNLKSLRPVPLLPSVLVLFLPFLLPILLMSRRNPLSLSSADI